MREKDDRMVTQEAFEEYHKRLLEYIGIHDDLVLEGESVCPKCGATITSYGCENCKEVKHDL